MKNDLLKMMLVGMLSAVISIAVGCNGCNSGIEGTYSDPTRTLVLVIGSGSAANLTFQGEKVDCTYATSGKQLSVECKNLPGKRVFTIQDDGSLSPPSDSFFPVLRKQK